jgi:hypothetical protein
MPENKIRFLGQKHRVKLSTDLHSGSPAYFTVE